MHRTLFLAFGGAMLASIPDAAAAQDVRVYSAPRAAFSYTTADPDRAMIGISTSTGSARDTLGILISSVVPDSPAEKAGLEEGNRIAAINGVSLRLAAVDVGDWDMANAMSRRLTREVGKVKAGDEVELRVYGNGQTRAVRVKTVAADSLYPSRRRVRDDAENRAVLGVSLGSTGSKRDTLGVLLMALDDEGPAVKAGLEEGNRIAAINGVDLRVPREDAGDALIGSAKVRRLQRELEKVKPGDEVSLRVYVGGGRMRDVRVKTVAASELPGRSTMIFGGSLLPLRNQGTPMPPMPARELELRRRLESQVDRAGRVMERVAPRIQTSVRRITI